MQSMKTRGKGPQRMHKKKVKYIYAEWIISCLFLNPRFGELHVCTRICINKYVN